MAAGLDVWTMHAFSLQTCDESLWLVSILPSMWHCLPVTHETTSLQRINILHELHAPEAFLNGENVQDSAHSCNMAALLSFTSGE